MQKDWSNHMPTSKMFAVVTLAMLLSGPSGTIACNPRQTIRALHATPSPAIETQQPATGEIKVLAEGPQSNIQDSFVAVVRDAETYAALRKLDGMLPELTADFFETDAVVAAFLGERPTGGFRVEISRRANAINVVEKKPGKDSMVTQMITSPFKVVSVAGGAKSPLSLTVDEAWRQRLVPFRVDSGQFKMSGGVAGYSREFKLEGEVRVMIEGRSLVTFVFAVRGSDPAKKRLLIESATGTVIKDGQITIGKMSAGSLIDTPNSGLKATGQISDPYSRVVLNMVSLPLMFTDGYGGMGTLTATATATTARLGSQ
jgi:hypothetical protein